MFLCGYVVQHLKNTVLPHSHIDNIDNIDNIDRFFIVNKK